MLKNPPVWLSYNNSAKTSQISSTECKTLTGSYHKHLSAAVAAEAQPGLGAV